MQDATAIERIGDRFRDLSPLMDERMRRQWAAAEATAYGWGGIQAVSQATGISPNTIRKGSLELRARRDSPGDRVPKRVRRAGGGRKSRADADPGLIAALEALVDPSTRGDSQSPLRWTCKSTRTLARELTAQGHPVISVATKKKGLVGDFKNGGREWMPQGQPDEVRVHDFIDKTLGKAIPYGVYDVTNNQGWVSVGIDHDTAQFAAGAIDRWWKKMGRKLYPGAKALLITADGGGSNGSRCRLWKVALQDLADRLKMTIHVCHFPPGTSKWNKIEHRMFCHITQNWRGRPLVSHDVIVQLIANTATRKDLTIRAELDTKRYPVGTKVRDEELAGVKLKPPDFHGDWNYPILPSGPKN